MTKRLLCVTMMCMVLISIMAVGDVLWLAPGWLATAAKVAVSTLAMLLRVIGVCAFICGLVCYAVARGVNSTTERTALKVVKFACMAVIAGIAMQAFHAPERAYMAVLHMILQANM